MTFARNISWVPFGRTDVLIGASDAPSPELSYGMISKAFLFKGVQKLGFYIFAATRERKVEKDYGRIWSYRGLDTTILNLFSTSTRWVWFQGHRGSIEALEVGFS